MTRMPKRSYYTILTLAAVGAILLVLPVKAFEAESGDLAQSSNKIVENSAQASLQFYEKMEITPNEEMAGVMIDRFEETIGEDDIVIRPDDI